MRTRPLTRRRARGSATIGLIAACTFVLAGCFNPMSLVDDKLQEVKDMVSGDRFQELIEEVSDGKVNIGASLADDFPAIPLPDGTLVQAVRVVDDGVMWGAHFEVADVNAEFAALGERFVAAGYESLDDGDIGGAMLLQIYTNGEVWVSVGALVDSAQGGAGTIQIMTMYEENE